MGDKGDVKVLKNNARSENLLSEESVELYDRQIRLWGGSAQRSIQSLKILIVGATGVGIELCKNLILTGIKSLTLLDWVDVDREDVFCQYTLKPADIGFNRAIANVQALKILNPNVEVNAEPEYFRKKSINYFRKFDVVIVTKGIIEDIIFLNEICREGGIKFFYSEVIGMFGFSFADVPPQGMDRISFHDLFKRYNFSATGTNTLQKMKNYCFILFLVLNRFKKKFERKPNVSKDKADKNYLRDICVSILNTLNTSQDYLPPEYLQINCDEFGPTCTIVGGFLAQDIMKCSYHDIESGLKYFDPVTCTSFCMTFDNPPCVIDNNGFGIEI